jgi:release factor glutamine methyltransferase
MNTLILDDVKAVESSKKILARLWSQHRRQYVNLFFYEQEVKIKDFDLTPLVDCGILSENKGRYSANVQVFPLSGRFICTDFNYSTRRKKGQTFLTEKDGVWGILPEETPLMAKKNIARKGDVVLDLATGSGMIGIFCAAKAKKVIVSDVNPRAIHYAKFNAILNGVAHKMEFRVGNLFEPVKRQKFDLIIWNGPTVAVPETKGKYPIYSDGGMDGASFTKQFIDQALKFLTPHGRLQWYDCAVGDDKAPVSMHYLMQKWRDKPVRAHFLSLTTEPLPLEKVFAVYDKYNLSSPAFRTPLSVKPVTAAEEKRWHAWLKQHGHTHCYYGIVTVEPARKFSFKLEFPKRDIRTDRYLTRYWLWMSYPTILKKIKVAESY